jgi:hypothetical protein
MRDTDDARLPAVGQEQVRARHEQAQADENDLASSIKALATGAQLIGSKDKILVFGPQAARAVSILQPNFPLMEGVDLKLTSDENDLKEDESALMLDFLSRDEKINAFILHFNDDLFANRALAWLFQYLLEQFPNERNLTFYISSVHGHELIKGPADKWSGVMGSLEAIAAQYHYEINIMSRRVFRETRISEDFPGFRVSLTKKEKTIQPAPRPQKQVMTGTDWMESSNAYSELRKTTQETSAEQPKPMSAEAIQTAVAAIAGEIVKGEGARAEVIGYQLQALYSGNAFGENAEEAAKKAAEKISLEAKQILDRQLAEQTQTQGLQVEDAVSRMIELAKDQKLTVDQIGKALESMNSRIEIKIDPRDSKFSLFAGMVLGQTKQLMTPPTAGTVYSPESLEVVQAKESDVKESASWMSKVESMTSEQAETIEMFPDESQMDNPEYLAQLRNMVKTALSIAMVSHQNAQVRIVVTKQTRKGKIEAMLARIINDELKVRKLPEKDSVSVRLAASGLLETERKKRPATIVIAASNKIALDRNVEKLMADEFGDGNKVSMTMDGILSRFLIGALLLRLAKPEETDIRERFIIDDINKIIRFRNQESLFNIVIRALFENQAAQILRARAA